MRQINNSCLYLECGGAEAGADSAFRRFDTESILTAAHQTVHSKMVCFTHSVLPFSKLTEPPHFCGVIFYLFFSFINVFLYEIIFFA